MVDMKTTILNMKSSNIFTIVNFALFIISLIVIIFFGKALEGFVGLVSVFVLVFTTVFLIDSIMSKL
ncbi:MAG: hypothetical protein ACP6IS_12080 [Candidatus Asgardarchaeia archaeon]